MPDTCYEPCPDETLMARYAAGDERAFAQLFQRHSGKLRRYLQRVTLNRTQAEDILQTTFLKVHASRHTYDASRPVRAWLYSIAIHARIDAIRTRQRRQEWHDIDVGHVECAAACPERVFAAPQTLSALDAALERLPSKQRRSFLLHHVEGLSFAEFARALSAEEETELTEVAIRVRVFRAMTVLRGVEQPVRACSARAA